MGNPHPTRSKSVKIGRKHTQAISAKHRTKRRNGMRIYSEIIKAKRKRQQTKIRRYWNGEVDNFPGNQ